MALTIEVLLQRILAQIPGAPLEDTVDTVKCGDVTQDLTGIVTTFLASYQVITRAVELGANLIITHEPTFYNHRDEVTWLAGNPVYEMKRQLLEQHDIVVWRFHDHWHRHRPDGILTGVTRALGWESYATEGMGPFFHIPQMTVGALVQTLKARLAIDMVRVIGDLDNLCRGVAILPGAAPMAWQIAALARKDVDVVIVGEVREWETSEYARDAVAEGQAKALIVLGHANSEEPGMAYLVEWLRPFVPLEIPITYVPTGDAFRYV